MLLYEQTVTFLGKFFLSIFIEILRFFLKSFAYWNNLIQKLSESSSSPIATTY